MGYFSTAAKAFAADFCFETLHALWTNTSDLVHGIRLMNISLEPEILHIDQPKKKARFSRFAAEHPLREIFFRGEK